MDLDALLNDRFGFSEFRPAQRQVIDCVMAGESVLAVMPTGSGKSLCYQLPALALPGLTLVVSPLIALMQDQIQHLAKLGLPATVINSTVSREMQRSRLRRALTGQFKILYIAPERFQSDEFRQALLSTRVSLFAVDEAHCVSLWGHDFRPDYLRLKDLTREMKADRILALTATATPTVRKDIAHQLGIDHAPHIVSGFDRPNLYLEVIQLSSAAEKIRSIAAIAREEKLGIVYAGTRKNVEDVYLQLKRLGLNAVAYHAGLSLQARKEVQERFMNAAECVIVATNAFGMGIDRREVRFVIHADFPASLEAYYQEIGRAGRDGKPARCVLLFNYGDKWIPEFLIDSNHPAPNVLKYIFAKICRLRTKTVVGEAWNKLAENRDPTFLSSIALLQRAGYLEKIQGTEGRGVRILKPDDSGLTELNFRELASRRDFEHRKLAVMMNYASRFRNHCYRCFILSYFGEWPDNQECGNCGRCAPGRVSRRA
jgi:ATP-dependent DNA helicase RecQ